MRRRDTKSEATFGHDVMSCHFVLGGGGEPSSVYFSSRTSEQTLHDDMSTTRREDQYPYTVPYEGPLVWSPPETNPYMRCAPQNQPTVLHRLRPRPPPALPPGDAFAFAIVEGGCTEANEAQDPGGGAQWKSDRRTDSAVCNHRYDSGRDANLNGIMCWQGTLLPYYL